MLRSFAVLALLSVAAVAVPSDPKLPSTEDIPTPHVPYSDTLPIPNTPEFTRDEHQLYSEILLSLSKEMPLDWDHFYISWLITGTYAHSTGKSIFYRSKRNLKNFVPLESNTILPAAAMGQQFTLDEEKLFDELMNELGQFMCETIYSVWMSRAADAVATGQEIFHRSSDFLENRCISLRDRHSVE